MANSKNIEIKLEKLLIGIAKENLDKALRCETAKSIRF